MNTRYALVSIIAVIGLAACGPQGGTGTTEAVKLETDAPVAANCPAADESGNIEVAPGLSARILETGYGRAAVVGDFADTNVWLWLYDETAEDKHGKFIWESGSNVFQFQLGAGQVIKGWDLGVPCMIEGETRELVVAGDLAYGRSGRGEIPPNATLIFTIELLKLTASQ
jgi:FKBP-type peptidyl-prolyl cis-trans isomerase FkpA